MPLRTALCTAALLLMAILAPAAALPGEEAVPPDVAKELEQANRDFTFARKPIHPLAIDELLAWESDSLPGPVAVDLDSTSGSNRYFGTFQRAEDGSVWMDFSTTDPVPNETTRVGTIRYRRLGTLKDNVHVLHVSVKGQGTLVSRNLLLVAFRIGYEYGEEGTRRYRVEIQRMGEFPLGDGFEGPIEVRAEENAIHVGPGTMCCAPPPHNVVEKKVISIR